MKVKFGNKKKELRAVWYDKGVIKVIDQRALPKELVIRELKNYREVATAIRTMVVRGAPSIGALAAYCIAQAKDPEKASTILKKTRPTAYDLFFGMDYVLRAIKKGDNGVKAAKRYADEIIDECKKIGINGEKLIRDGAQILTHCNAGALATVDVGTALSPIKFAHYNNKNIFVFVSETRPLLQGARLTSWELLQEDIPHAIITDSASGHFMKKKEIDMVIVGADRITLNCDVVNKIGTYEKAVLAKENMVDFYVAAPNSTFDFKTKRGGDVLIEERSEEEVVSIEGKRIAPKGAHSLNPAFDVTPSKFITGFITKDGVFTPEEMKEHWRR
ncbi:MAG: S-methyl-5-thioribose-1-phosphate isomerase [Candidatus Thermoplasmatota archaeon]